MSAALHLIRGLTLSLLCCAPVLQAQETPDKPPCSIRFVNCVSTADNVVFTLDGKNTNPNGYAAGKSSGWIGVKPGGHLVTATHPELGSIRLNLRPAKGESIALITLKKVVPGVKGDESAAARLRYLTVPFRVLPGRTDARQVTLLSVAELDAVEVTVGTSSNVTLKRFELTQVAQPIRGSVTAAVKHGAELLRTLNFEQHPHQAVVIYQDAAGKLAALDFFRP